MPLAVNDHVKFDEDGTTHKLSVNNSTGAVDLTVQTIVGGQSGVAIAWSSGTGLVGLPVSAALA